MRVFCLYMYVHAEQCLVSRLFPPPPKCGFSPVRGFAIGFFSWWRCVGTSSELGVSCPPPPPPPPAQLGVQVLFVVSGVRILCVVLQCSMLCV